MTIELIKVENSSLSGDITNFENYVNQFADCQANMVTQIEELSTKWSGPSKETFMREFKNDCDFLDEMKSALNEMIETMRYALSLYQECDNDVSAIVSGLKV